MNSTYVINPANSIFTHGFGLSPGVVNDIEDISRDKLQVCLRSGDYFAMLATLIDEISDSIEADEPAESYRLQKIVEDLLFLQREYKIVQKDQTDI